MRLDRYTVKAQEVLQAAQALASQAGHPEIRDIHLLLALISHAEGIVAPTLRKIGADPVALAASAKRAVERIPKVQGDVSEPGVSRSLRETLENAEKAAGEFKDEYVSSEHFLLALARGGESDARGLLASAGASPDSVLAALREIRGNQRVTDPNP